MSAGAPPRAISGETAASRTNLLAFKDVYDEFGYGEWDLVPAKLVGTGVLETSSDEWYVDFDGDGVGEAAVGRLPVRTVEEAEEVVRKIVSSAGASLRGERLMMVADRNDGFDFEGASGEARGALPGDVEVEEVLRGRLGSAEARSEVLAGLGEGRLAVNYLGHGSVSVWGGNVLTAKDAPLLSGTSRPTVFLLMTCLNGFYHDLYGDSLAEALLLRSGGGGASAVWASSGLTDPQWQAELDREFLRALFSGDLTVGEAAARAKLAVPDPDVRATWILFGDPAMKVR